MSDTKGNWTVSKILKKYSSFGLPHFQRGHVWNSDSVSLLLESLFYETPCGTIVLWKPKDPHAEGVPLPGAEKLEYLLIDGQQRIRSIHDALKDLATDVSDEEEDSDEDREDEKPLQIWCLNLMKIPELAPHLEKGSLAEKPLFMKVVDPRKTKNKRFKYNLIPLRVLIDEGNGNSPLEWEYISPAKNSSSEKILRKAEEIKLRNRIRAIYKREFFVIVKQEARSKNNLVDVVQLYNRINSGGMRVQAEERAYATLISLRRQTNEWLRNLFFEIHQVRGKSKGDLVRDEILQRTRERRFGFKIFIRAMVQTASFHFGYSVGSSSLSFDVVHRQHFHEYLKNQRDSRIEELYSECTRVLTTVVEVLRDDLFCDTFEFLPDTVSLVPVFQLLLKYPELVPLRSNATSVRSKGNPAHRKLVAHYIYKLMLARLNQRELLEIARHVKDSNTLAECDAIIRRVSLPKLAHNLKYSNSLQDRYVLMLYWLVRKHHARDFLHEQLDKKKQVGKLLPGKEHLISSGVDPEKQHVVPYAKLKLPYGISARGRVSNHIVNNVGNLTYISRLFNYFETGLGEQMLDLSLEFNKKLANLKAHFILDPFEEESSRKVLSAYEKVRTMISKQDRGKKGAEEHGKLKREFEKYCRYRRNLIEKGFRMWLSELESDSVIEERFDKRTEPTPQLFNRSTQDLIRALNYDNRIEDQLLRLCTSDSPFSLHLVTEKSGEKLIGVDIRIKEKKSRQKTFSLIFDEDHIDLLLLKPKNPKTARILKHGNDLAENETETQPGLVTHSNRRISLHSIVPGSAARIAASLLSFLNDVLFGVAK